MRIQSNGEFCVDIKWSHHNLSRNANKEPFLRCWDTSFKIIISHTYILIKQEQFILISVQC